MSNIIRNYKDGEGEATILMYGDIDSWDINAKTFVSVLSELEKEHCKISLRINSCGGSVFEGLAIYNAIRNSPADITIYVDGVAASMASVIALCGKRVLMSKYSHLMIHCVSGGAYGNTKEIAKALEEMRRLETTIISMYADKTGKKPEEIEKEYFDGQDHWLTADEALAAGFVDGIYENDNQPVEPMNHTDIYNFYNQLIQTNKTDEEMIEKIKKIPSFADCANEGDVIARMSTLAAKAEKADALQQELDEMKKAAADKEITSLLNAAIEAHKINDVVAENLKKVYADKAEELKALLDAMPEKKKVVIANETKDELVDKTWDELDRSGKLEELKAKHPDVFEAKFAEKFGEKK